MAFNDNRVFAENGGKTNINDTQYGDGWDFIGSTPPSVEDFNSVMNETDSRVVALNKGHKNYLINANLNTTIINTRGFAGGQPAAGVYGYDRWKGDVTGTKIEQVVENSENINEPYVISWVGGTGTAEVNGVSGLNSGDSFTLTAAGNFSVIVPTDATYIQLERGDVPTDFEYRRKQVEESLCEWYTIILEDPGNMKIFCSGQAVSAVTAQCSLIFPKMRATPAVSFSAAADFAAIDSVGTPTAAAGGISADQVTDSSCRVILSGLGGLVAGNATRLQGRSSNAFILLDAEL